MYDNLRIFLVKSANSCAFSGWSLTSLSMIYSKSYTTVGCFGCNTDSFKEFFKWEWAVDTHDAWTKVIVRRVKWYGKVNLNTFC